MHPELFKIGPFGEFGPISVKSYGTMIAIGIVFAIVLARIRAKKRGIDDEPIIDIAIYGILGGVIGAKLLFIITELPNVIKNPPDLMEFLLYGFVLYGAIIGGALSAYIYCRSKKISFLTYFDLVAPSIAFAQAFGRIGCFLAGCCYGKETSCSLGVEFNNSPFVPSNISVHPTQLYSSIGNFIIGLLLITFASKERKRGQVGGLYMILYSIGRFVIEFLRGDPRGDVWIFSTSQFICLFVLLGGITLFNIDKIKAPASHK